MKCKIPACKNRGAAECIGCGKSVCKHHVAVLGKERAPLFARGWQTYCCCRRCVTEGNVRGKVIPPPHLKEAK